MRAGFFTLLLLGVVACGGAKRQTAKDPSDDPKPTSDEEVPKWEGASSHPDETTTTSTPAGRPVNEGPHHRADQYDKEATEVVLKRSARQVKDNCGAASDENGKASGPWGKLTIHVELGHNGHSKKVDVPDPYAGKPVGSCIQKAFDDLMFPPWAGSDTTVDWEVELVQPK